MHGQPRVSGRSILIVRFVALESERVNPESEFPIRGQTAQQITIGEIPSCASEAQIFAGQVGDTRFHLGFIGRRLTDCKKRARLNLRRSIQRRRTFTHFMETINKQFGLMIAYLLPGFIALGGVALIVPSVARWLQPLDFEGLSGIGPPVYAVLSAIAAGMICSCVRWLLIDHTLHAMGVRSPRWNPSQLESHLASFNYLVESHYRYYQFYANTIVAIAWTYLLHRSIGTVDMLGPGTDMGVLILCAVLFAGARDSLSKYYNRTALLVGSHARIRASKRDPRQANATKPRGARAESDAA